MIIWGIIYRHWIINNNGILCRYTGQTIQETVEDRAMNGKGYKGCTLFNNYINKYDWENFNTEIIKEGYYTQEQLDNYEIFYIKEDKNNPDIKCLNIADGGHNGKYRHDLREVEDQICINYNKGMSARKIAEKYNTNHHTICNVLEENNITIRTKSENQKGENNPSFKHYLIDELQFIIYDLNIDPNKYGNIEKISSIVGITSSYLNRALARRGLTLNDI